MPSLHSISNRTLVFILAEGNGNGLLPLTRHRAPPVMPFAGTHRLIDFPLSNCLNSGLKQIYILTQHQAPSIQLYIRSIAPAFNHALPANGGGFLHCLPPGYGKRYAIFQNLEKFRPQEIDYVVVISSDQIYRMDYRALLQFHIDRRADVTIAALRYPRRLSHGFGVLEADTNGKVTDLTRQPRDAKPIPGSGSKCLVDMGVYVFNIGALTSALTRVSSPGLEHDFSRDVLPALIKEASVQLYDHSRSSGRAGRYWRDVGTLDNYYRANMEFALMGEELGPWNQAEWPLHSMAGNDDPQSRITRERSIVPRGVGVSWNASVCGSVISPAVEIGPSAEIRDSILMTGVRVGQAARIRRAIIEQDVRIPDFFEIGFDPEKDRKVGVVTDDGVCVVVGNSSLKRQNFVLVKDGTVSAAPTAEAD